MTEDKKQQNTTPPMLKSGGTSKEMVVSTIAGAVSGVVAAGAAIRKEFNDEAKSLPGMADYVSGGTTVEGLTTKHTRDLIKADLEFKGKPEQSLELQKKIRELKKAHVQDKINLFEKEYGIASTGIKGFTTGTYQRLMRLGGSNMGEVLFKGASVATIIGVGMYNLLTSIATRKKAREIEDLILDRVLEEPVKPSTVATHAHSNEPHTKVSHIESHERLQAAKEPEMSMGV